MRRLEESVRQGLQWRNLHQLRHSALTRDAEHGTGTPMLMKRSGHTSVRSLAKYAHVSDEVLMRH